MAVPVRLGPVFDSSLGRLGISTPAGRLSRVIFLPAQHALIVPGEQPARRLVERLTGCFDNPNADLDMWRHLSCTDFQRRVWRALQRIDVGTACITEHWLGGGYQRTGRWERVSGQSGADCDPLPPRCPAPRRRWFCRPWLRPAGDHQDAAGST